jgi:NADPH-dependent glutamate synthase beta subunit-like oxidoreductase
VVPVLDLLREYNLHGHAKVGKKVVIIGGGNVAMDTARAVLHCGAEIVQLFCLEPSSEMPAHEWEIQEAAAEGVIINPSWGPRKILGDGQKVTGVEFIYCKSVFDDERKFCPLFDETKTHVVEADMVISAVGQSPNLGFLGKWVDVSSGAIVVDPLTMETSLPGVFAGGDAVLGTTSVIEAMVTGRTAAVSISRYLEGCI